MIIAEISFRGGWRDQRLNQVLTPGSPENLHVAGRGAHFVTRNCSGSLASRSFVVVSQPRCIIFTPQLAVSTLARSDPFAQACVRLSVSDMLRKIKYLRHEFHHKPVACENSLLGFVYDIPYFPACGIFPPFHVLNQVFTSGGGDGGMGPGASWEPFTITQEEYRLLKNAIADTPISEIAPNARYAFVQYKFDAEFDSIHERFAWMNAVCKKHRESWHAELEKAGKLV